MIDFFFFFDNVATTYIGEYHLGASINAYDISNSSIHSLPSGVPMPQTRKLTRMSELNSEEFIDMQINIFPVLKTVYDWEH